MTGFGASSSLSRVPAEVRSLSDLPTLTEREFLVTAFGDLVGRPPEMRAVAIVAQNPSHGPALDVAIDAVLPGIDLEPTTYYAVLG